jgi:hypothetical protein
VCGTVKLLCRPAVTILAVVCPGLVAGDGILAAVALGEMILTT